MVGIALMVISVALSIVPSGQRALILAMNMTHLITGMIASLM